MSVTIDQAKACNSSDYLDNSRSSRRYSSEGRGYEDNLLLRTRYAKYRTPFSNILNDCLHAGADVKQLIFSICRMSLLNKYNEVVIKHDLFYLEFSLD